MGQLCLLCSSFLLQQLLANVVHVGARLVWSNRHSSCSLCSITDHTQNEPIKPPRMIISFILTRAHKQTHEHEAIRRAACQLCTQKLMPGMMYDRPDGKGSTTQDGAVSPCSLFLQMFHWNIPHSNWKLCASAGLSWGKGPTQSDS